VVLLFPGHHGIADQVIVDELARLQPAVLPDADQEAVRAFVFEGVQATAHVDLDILEDRGRVVAGQHQSTRPKSTRLNKTTTARKAAMIPIASIRKTPRNEVPC